MATAPTFSDIKGSTWTARASSPEQTASTTWSAGDLVVVAAATEDQTVTLSTPTVAGLTFTLATSQTGDASSGNVYIWTATAASGGSGVIQSTYTNSRAVGLEAYVLTGHGGVGNVSVTTSSSSALTRSLVRAGDNSAVIGVLVDWNATNDTAVTPSPTTNGTVDQAAFTSGAATMFAVHWGDQGTAGTTSYGIGSFTGTADMAIALIEIKGAAGGSTTQVAATRRVVYNVQTQVAATRRVNYAVQAQVAATRRVNYGVLAGVAATRRVAYSVAAAVLAARSIRYDVQAPVAASRRVVFDVAASSSQVTAPRRVGYSVSAPVSTARRVLYDVVRGAVATRTVNYDVVTSARASRRVAYSVAGNVNAPRHIIYTVDGPVGPPVVAHVRVHIGARAPQVQTITVRQ